MGDFNIDINTAGIEVYKLDKFCNLFDLTNLIKAETCCTKNHKYAIGLFLTNRPLSLQKLSKSMLPKKRRFSEGIMHLLSTENLGKKYINEVV